VIVSSSSSNAGGGVGVVSLDKAETGLMIEIKEVAAVV
jgi:hypothetical protein